jgi:hypothetical protein
METVSSSLTFFYKFILTTVWPAGFGLASVVMLLNGKPETMKFAVVWAIGTAFLLPCARLKRVEVDGAILVISNYLRDITVPVSEIADVRQNRLINIRPVTVAFRNETPFGRAITFMPLTSFRLFSEDDIVKRLRSLAGGCERVFRST